MRPISWATAPATVGLSPVMILTVMPSCWALRMAAGVVFFKGSTKEMAPLKTRSVSSSCLV